MTTLRDALAELVQALAIDALTKAAPWLKQYDAAVEALAQPAEPLSKQYAREQLAKQMAPVYAAFSQPAESAEMTDTERLDMVEREGYGIERDLEGEWNLVKFRRYGNPIRFASRVELRAAIDAARAGGGNGR